MEKVRLMAKAQRIILQGNMDLDDCSLSPVPGSRWHTHSTPCVGSKLSVLRCLARSCTLRLPRRPGQVHAVMNKAENFDNTVRRQSIDDQVPRVSDPILGYDQAAGQAQRKRAQPLHPGHRLGTGKARGGTDFSQGRQDQLVVADSRVDAELLCASHNNLVDALFGVANKAVGHYLPSKANRACNRPMMRCSKACASSGPEMVV